MNNTKKNKKSRKKTLLVIGILALMIVSLTPTNVFKVGVQAYETQSVTDFTHVRQITINHNYVNAWLHDFPVYVYNVSDDLKDTDTGGNIRPDGYDIAFYSSDNNTQYAHEIEYYDGTTGTLCAWVNVTDISPSADTIFYMYYGDADSSNQENVFGTWDGNYIAVWHMKDNATDGILDSSQHFNNLSKNADNNSYQELTNAHVGYCQLFNGASSANLSGGPFTHGAVHPYSFMVWSRVNGTGTYQNMLFKELFLGNTTNSIEVLHSTDDPNKYKYAHRTSGDGWQVAEYNLGTTDVWFFNWAYMTGGTDAYLFRNISNLEASMTSTTFKYFCGDFQVGGAWATAGYWSYPFTGYVDEFWISQVTRNGSYYGAIYNNTNSPELFLTFGTGGLNPQDTSSEYQILGLPGTSITWAGTTGTTVWCNNSGDTYETLELNMSVNYSQNISEVRVWVGDINNSDSWANASNISVQFSSNNYTWGNATGNTTAFTDGGSNVSVNDTFWTEANGCYGPDPFADGPINRTNASIFMRFKLTIPSEAGAHMHYNAIAWKIYIGEYT